MNIVIRSDSSSDIGVGHTMRDLVLATRLKKENPNAKIFFAVQNLDGNINRKIIESGYELIILDSNKKSELLKIIQKQNAKLLVIDHYEIDYKYESYIKANSGVKILVLDDTYEKHNCDTLLNHNISADEKRYKNLLPANCEIKCGAKYTLLRDEFYKAKKKRKTKTKKKSVLLAMGGADHSNLNIKILKVLQGFKNIQTTIVTTEANKNLDELKKHLRTKENITLHVNSNNIAELMRESDFAILTPSVSVNEAYFMKLPFIAIKTAKNQDDMYKFLRKKFLVLSKFNKYQLRTKIAKILKRVA